jgi:hypothetical protein
MSEEEQRRDKRVVSWDDIEKELDESEPEFLKLEEGQRYILKFLRDAPRESPFINPEGKEVIGYEFWVEYEGRPRMLSVTSIRFLDTLRELRKITGTLEGAEILVVKKGHGMNTTYVVALTSFPEQSSPKPEQERKKRNPQGWHKVDTFSRIPIYEEVVDWIMSKQTVTKDELADWLEEQGFNESTADRMAYGYFAYLDRKGKGIRGKKDAEQVFIPILDMKVNGEEGKL